MVREHLLFFYVLAEVVRQERQLVATLQDMNTSCKIQELSLAVLDLFLSAGGGESHSPNLER